MAVALGLRPAHAARQPPIPKPPLPPDDRTACCYYSDKLAKIILIFHDGTAPRHFFSKTRSIVIILTYSEGSDGSLTCYASSLSCRHNEAGASMQMKNKYITLLLTVAVWFVAGSCKPKPVVPGGEEPTGPTPVVNCKATSGTHQQRGLFLSALLDLLVEKKELSQEEAIALFPQLNLLANGQGSTRMEELKDNHVCQVDQKRSLFKEETSKAGRKWYYVTDLGDRITVGLVKGEKAEVFGQVLPKGATEAFGLTWKQK